jgi:hypothetical protein
MSDELFPPESVASPSPRLRWMQRHRIKTFHDENRDDENAEFAWAAWSELLGDYTNEDDAAYMLAEGHVCFGETEDEALNNFCIENKIKYWNEADPL